MHISFAERGEHQFGEHSNLADAAIPWREGSFFMLMTLKDWLAGDICWSHLTLGSNCLSNLKIVAYMCLVDSLTEGHVVNCANMQMCMLIQQCCSCSHSGYNRCDEWPISQLRWSSSMVSSNCTSSTLRCRLSHHCCPCQSDRDFFSFFTDNSQKHCQEHY